MPWQPFSANNNEVGKLKSVVSRSPSFSSVRFCVKKDKGNDLNPPYPLPYHASLQGGECCIFNSIINKWQIHLCAIVKSVAKYPTRLE